MPKVTPLDRQWQQLMALCDSESSLRSAGTHARLLKLVVGDIEELASRMGFSPRCIAGREFRAHRLGNHIVAIIAD